MALPPNVAAPVAVLNQNVSKILADREVLQGLFDDRLGGSIWSLLSGANQIVVKNAIVNDLQTAIDGLQSAKNTLAAL